MHPLVQVLSSAILKYSAIIIIIFIIIIIIIIIIVIIIIIINTIINAIIQLYNCAYIIDNYLIHYAIIYLDYFNLKAYSQV